MASYIPDGWNRDGYIEGSKPNEAGERLWDSLTFKYRPATRMDVVKLDAQIGDALASGTPEAAVKAEMLGCQFVATRVQEWDLKAGGVHPVPVSADSCSRINSQLFTRLYEIIRGSRLNDPKPADEKPPPSDEELLGNSPAGSGS